MPNKTVFRKYSDGEIIALFPLISKSGDGLYCQSYMHDLGKFGQYGVVIPHIVVQQTTLATPDEYAELLVELEQIGYNPVVVKRCTYKDSKIRKNSFRKG